MMNVGVDIEGKFHVHDVHEDGLYLMLLQQTLGEI